MSETVKPDSLITLNYKISAGENEILISTFDSRPATLKLGCGELMPTLEACLEGLAVGERRTFNLEPEQAFGPHNKLLVQRVPRDELPVPDAQENTLLEFTAPNGEKFKGLVLKTSEGGALVDFNHPLAGKSVCFEVEIIGVL